MSNKPLQFRPSGTIEFEQVVFDSPAVDTQAPVPVPVAVDEALDADPLSINFGRRKDARPTAAERMLAGTSIDWLVAFPPEARPKALCERFPHVANRLANEWSRKATLAQSLQSLAGDARWGSAGFPVQVQVELKRLIQDLGAVQP
jgi:hypothetical protein